MRIVFMGTPEFAIPTLTEIIGQGHEVVAVYTRAPKPAGRGMELQLSPVHRTAEYFSLPVYAPKTLRTEEAAATMQAHAADVAVVVAYGLILPKAILDAPAQGCLNLHGSLLPRWRGAAPVERAIMAGDAKTGVMVMRMDEGLDTGPIALAERLPLGSEMNAGEVRDALAKIGADLMVRALAALARGALEFYPQPEEGVTYAHKIDKAEARLDWNQPVVTLHNKVRGLAPAPGAFFEADLGKGIERVKVLRSSVAPGQGAPGTVLDDGLTIACGEGALRLVTVQRAGRGPMSADEFARGIRSLSLVVD